METSQSHTSLGLERAIKMLRRRGWIIVLCVVLTAGAAFAFSKAQTREYTATAALLFNNTTVAQQASGVPVVGQTDPQGQRATNLTLVQLADVVSQRTSTLLANGITTKQVRAAVVATPQGQSNVVSVQATWPHPETAARIANTFAAAFIQKQKQNQQAGVQSAIALVQTQYAALTPQQQGGNQGQSLLNHLESLKILKAMQSNTQLVQPATVPTVPSSPKVLRNTVLGAILGLLLGVGLAILLERLDRRMRDPGEIEESIGLPMLGLIPHGSSRGPSGDGAFTVAMEPFRLLRAHLRYFNVDRELRTLLVTSAQPSEGKTTIARMLAAAAASMGTRTLLIEADLRRPTLTRVLGLQPGIGLAGVLVGAIDREAAIRHLDVEGRMNGSASGRLLDVLVAGETPPNPTELLESHAMEDLLQWARDSYELVVIDTAPLSLVADAIPLMKRVDGVIVVSRLGLSRRDASSRLRDRLDKLGAPLLGVVVNDVSRRGGSYDYGYGYDAAYSPPESPAPPPPDMSGDRELTSSSQAASISEN